MKKLTITLYITLSLFFSSCGDNTLSPIKDVSSIEIKQQSFSLYSTDSDSLSATVHFSDATQEDATTELEWQSSDTNVVSVSNGVLVPGNANGGDANITVTFADLRSAPSLVNIIPLTSFSITNADINVTGEHILEAEGTFSDGQTKIIMRNIVWSADNGATISVVNNIATINIIAGDTNVTATVFGETNSSSPIAPQSKIYTIE